MAYDAARGRAVLFGGSGALPTTQASLFPDTWELPAGGAGGGGTSTPGILKLDSLTVLPSTVAQGTGGFVELEVRLEWSVQSSIEVQIYRESFFGLSDWNPVLKIPVTPGAVTGSVQVPAPVNPGRYRFKASHAGHAVLTTLTVT
jgi:hypothetical protein